MPWYFHFRAPNNIHFDEQLISHRCNYILKNKKRCKRRVVIGLPCCASHLPLKYKLQVRESLIPGANKGVFAYDPNKGANDIIFRRNDDICPYNGEVINANTLKQRYGRATGPYAVELDKGIYEDAAVYRGIGSLINHKVEKLCNSILYLDEDVNRIMIIAKKNIRNNQELYVNYGSDYKLIEPGVESSTNNKKSTV